MRYKNLENAQHINPASILFNNFSSMKKLILLSLLALLGSGTLHAQVIVSTENLGELTTTQIENTIGVSGPYGVALHKVIYTLLDHNDELDTVSGLFMTPVNPLTESNIVLYCHGTSSDADDVPSNFGQGFPDALYFATNGFITVAPDYIGLGESDGAHPYVHSETEALAGLYFYTVALELIYDLGLTAGPELFVAGYSQGGHASMALQQMIETDFSSTISLTAAAHGSGPYSLSGVMRDLIIGDEVYLPVGFIPNFIIGYEAIYGNIYNDLEDIFKPTYLSQIRAFESGQIDLVQLSTQLALSLFFNAGATIPKFLMQDSIVDRLVANDANDPLIAVLRENDTYNFQANAPTRLYYCDADDVVPFENSIVADSFMQLRSPSDLQLVQVDPNAGHGACAEGAIPMSVDFFLSFINVGTVEESKQVIERIFPNPANDFVDIQLRDLSTPFNYELQNMAGKRLVTGVGINGYHRLALGDYPSGLYVLQIEQDGVMHTSRIVKQ